METPAQGSDAHMEACRDYDEKIEFLQSIRSRSGVDKSHHRSKYIGHSRNRGVTVDDEDQNVNLLRMSGSSFFRTSVHVDPLAEGDDIIDEEIQKVSES